MLFACVNGIQRTARARALSYVSTRGGGVTHPCIDSNATKFEMSMHQIFLPDDVKYSCFGDDDFKREDELILLERDEWLEIESPSFSHPTVFDNVRFVSNHLFSL